eukprot:CAMPEP_0170135322 /NCGR_PEP_ID=MMETSP0033_2-20121228/2422_1 /TAXON_ID=195969 /ORGANISM="Dolichomastix tenuilepis, Strain CCMP3274" /LENGTH=221 /DNA_ID=CAMNT_0010370921 /DNA_START=54 /DNA_END=719 /DNA_ORIENTATION=-
MSGVALVLGVGPGIGLSVAKRWAQSGKVAVACRTAAKAKELAAAAGPNVTGYAADVTDPASLSACVEAVEKDLGTIDFLCYNAGSGVWKKPFEITLDEFEACWRTNAAGLLNAAQLVCPKMVERGSGAIAITGATASLRGKPFTAGFAAAKGAQRMLAQSLARDLGPKGVHCFLAIIDGGVGDREGGIAPDAIAQTYWDVAHQPSSCWTFEIDVRPSVENW